MIEPKLIAELSLAEIENIQKNLFAVHTTNYKPAAGRQIAAHDFSHGVIPKILQEEKLGEIIDMLPNVRPTLHWCLSRVVPTLIASDDTKVAAADRKYAIITKLHNLFPQLLNLYIKDTIILGNYQLTAKDYVLIPEGEDPTPWKGTGATIVFYSPDQKKLDIAVRDFIKSQGGIIFTKNENLTKEDEEAIDEFVTIEGLNIVFNEQEPDIFNGMLESLAEDGVSFGREEESFNCKWIMYYIARIQLSLFSELIALFFPSKKDDFYLKNRETYLETIQGMLLSIKENLFKAISNSERYPAEVKDFFKSQQNNNYMWIKFLEIEKHLYAKYNKTISRANATCILYLIKHKNLTTAALLSYVDEHLENFQSIHDVIEKYKLETKDFISDFIHNFLPFILFEDFIKEPLLTNNPGNILLYMIFKYEYENIQNNSGLSQKVDILINLLDEACAKLLVSSDVSKDTYVKSIYESTLKESHPKMLEYLLERSSKFKEYYTKSTTIKDHRSTIFSRIHSDKVTDETKITDDEQPLPNKKPRLQ